MLSQPMFPEELRSQDGSYQRSSTASMSWTFVTPCSPICYIQGEGPRALIGFVAGVGATVSVVHSGRAALQSLDQFDPDTMLLDIGMPEMDGYEVARRVRATPNHAKTLLIALT
jgi:hypothetical protein